jgi:NAD(P)-dependent dehydrogenase (short-subunit alcohol dehydrogenase family)
MIFQFEGVQVLVTGGSNGIGFAIASAFADAGANVTITGTRKVAADYDRDLSRFAYRQCRLSDPADIEELAAGLEALDVLVNNAGQSRPGGKSEWEPDVFTEVVGIDLIGGYRVAQACLPLLKRSKMAGGASVVNNLSLTVFFGEPTVPAYGAAKAGLAQLTKTLAVDWAPHGIRVNAVAPGLIATDLSSALDRDPARRAAFLARIPLGRFGTPRDVASSVLYLATPESEWITGTCLVLDGGQMAGQ